MLFNVVINKTNTSRILFNALNNKLHLKILMIYNNKKVISLLVTLVQSITYRKKFLLNKFHNDKTVNLKHTT